MLNLKWMKCQGGVWCKLNNVNLDHQHFDHAEGVYIIWHGGKDPHVVYVGQGNIRDRIREHRRNLTIQEFNPKILFVTWASVGQQYRNGIEKYLFTRWNPKVTLRAPDVQPIPVNSPFE